MGSITRKDSILLDNVSSRDIDNYLNPRFSSSYAHLEKIHEAENELQYTTNYQGNRAILYLWRESHNPFSLQLKVEFNSDRQINQSRYTYGSRNMGSGSNFLFIILILMLARFLFPLLGLLLFDPVGILLLFGVVLAYIYFRRKPKTQSGSYKKQGVQAEQLLMQIKGILSEMKILDGSDRKCWNCFEPVEAADNVCGFCGKSQR